MKINKKSVISLLVLVCILASFAMVAFATEPAEAPASDVQQVETSAAEGGENAQNDATPAPWYVKHSGIIMIVLMVAIFYFLLIRPENKKKKEAAKMRDSLKAGDKITTIGGIVGRVVKVKDDELVIESSTDKSKLRIMKWAVSTIDKPASEKKSKNEDVAEETAELEAPETANEQTSNEAEEK